MIKMIITYTDQDGVDRTEYRYFKMRKKENDMDLTDVIPSFKDTAGANHAISEIQTHGNFCAHCGRAVNYRVMFSPVTFHVGDTELTYKEASAICMECNHEIYVPAINDQNVNARRLAYFKTTRGV